MDKKKNIIIQIIFWILFFILTNRIIGLREYNNIRAFIDSTVIVLFFAGISYLNVGILIPNLLTRKKYALYIIIVLGILILIPTLFVKFDLVHISPRRDIIERRMHRPLFIHPKFVLIFFINSLFIFVSTIIKLSLDFAKKERQRIQIEKERLLIETQYLRSQMNPHFFLNALNNLQYINRFLPQQSDKYINTLAEMMRYVTYDCKKDKVSIEKEVEYIKNYVYFQQVKDNEVKVNSQIDIQDSDTLIEPMLLMPFVENAFKFGICEAPEKHPIFINIKQYENTIYFSCKNSINPSIKSNTDPSYSGLGLKNVKERLNANYPNKHNLEIKINTDYFYINLKLNI